MGFKKKNKKTKQKCVSTTKEKNELLEAIKMYVESRCKTVDIFLGLALYFFA